MDLTDMYRIVHLIAKEYIFYWASHRTFYRIYYIVRHKDSLWQNSKALQDKSSKETNRRIIPHLYIPSTWPTLYWMGQTSKHLLENKEWDNGFHSLYSYST
jgi:hypothetical protein